MSRTRSAARAAARAAAQGGLCGLTVARGSALVAAGEISPVEWSEALLERIAAIDGRLNAFITVAAEQALAAAHEAEREIAAGRRRGPLHGVPFALKDLIDTAGLRTTAHSRLAEDRVPSRDATVTRRLRDAGAVLLGKLALHEFAHGGPSLDLPWPLARNPWSPDHFAGSSSSGSGVAVAAAMVPASIGTDTGGSIRIPAALCGIAGLKPTFGLVSRHGVIPCSYSLDHCGPMAWTSEDCALLLGGIAGHDPLDPASARCAVPAYASLLTDDLAGVRIGVVRHFWESDLPASAEAARSIEAALEVLAYLGARLEDVRLRPLAEYNDVRVVVQEPEVFSVHRRDLATRSRLYGRDFLGRILAGCLIGGDDYVSASRVRRRMAAGMLDAMRDLDALVTLGPGPAPRLDAERTFGFVFGLWGKPNLTSPFSVTGFPALSVCSGFSQAGLPLSMQVASRPFDDATALRIGHAYERATAWRERRPPEGALRESEPIRLARNPPAPPLDDETRAYVDGCARRAGLALDDEQRALLYEAAPYALEMVRRIAPDLDWDDEPASVFFVDGSIHPRRIACEN